MRDEHASVTPPDSHVVTAQEALEPLFLSLELETDARMLAAASAAGWSAEEAIEAIDELRRKDVLVSLGDGERSE